MTTDFLYTEHLYLPRGAGLAIFTAMDEALEIDGLPAKTAGRAGRGARLGHSHSPLAEGGPRPGRADDVAPACSSAELRWRTSDRHGASVRERSGGPCLIGELRGLNALVRRARLVCRAAGPGWR